MRHIFYKGSNKFQRRGDFELALRNLFKDAWKKTRHSLKRGRPALMLIELG